MDEHFEDEDKLAAIRSWAEDDRNSWFDTTFTESLEDYLEEQGELTEKQSEALDNIVAKNNINIAEWL